MAKKESKLGAYLKAKGVTNNTPFEEIEALKKAYWREYQRKREKRRRKEQKRCTVSMSTMEYQELAIHADLHGMKVAGFIKKAALAYVQKGYIPRHKEEINAMIAQMRAVGNTINQTVQKLHRRTAYYQKRGIMEPVEELQLLKADFEKLRRSVEGLKKDVEGFIHSSPKGVGEVLKEQLTGRPERIKELRSWLDQLEG